MPRGIKLTEDTLAEIVAMANNGMKASDIAAETDMSINTIFRVLKRAGISTLSDGADGAGRGKLSARGVEQVIERYLARDNIATICEDANISISHLYDILREAEVQTHQESGAAQREQRLNDAITMYTHKVPIYEITEATGVSGYSLNIELHKRGIPLRRPRRYSMETHDVID